RGLHHHQAHRREPAFLLRLTALLRGLVGALLGRLLPLLRRLAAALLLGLLRRTWLLAGALRLPFGYAQHPTRLDQIRIGQRATARLHLTTVQLVDLRPPERITQLTFGDVPQRVTWLHGVLARLRRL